MLTTLLIIAASIWLYRTLAKTRASLKAQVKHDEETYIIPTDGVGLSAAQASAIVGTLEAFKVNDGGVRDKDIESAIALLKRRNKNA